MFKYDFIILYEHRNRELENAVLLAMKLEKKGYKVAIEFRRSGKILFQKAKVLITPFFYNDKTVVDFAIKPFYQFKKVINMQYEQVFTEGNEALGNSMPNGYARLANHIAWGKKPEELMLKNGIDKDNIFTIGHVSMDMNQKKYDKAFYSRKMISKKFGIPDNKRWNLFISSFSCINISKAELEQWAEMTQDIYDFTRISELSYVKVINWLDKILSETDDYIIYRPHPHEIDNKEIKELEKKHKNFICNSSYSIRQWIRVCDSIFTWCSTSIVDAYYAGKKCAIIRPVPFPQELQYRIYNDQKYIEQYDDFKRFITSPDEYPEINGSTIKEYYCNESDEDTFDKLVSVCEKVYNSDDSVDYKRLVKYSKAEVVKIAIYNILMSIAGFVDYGKIMPEKYRADIYYSHREMVNYKKEIAFHKKRFLRVFGYEKK